MPRQVDDELNWPAEDDPAPKSERRLNIFSVKVDFDGKTCGVLTSIFAIMFLLVYLGIVQEDSSHTLSATMPIRTDAKVEDDECEGTVMSVDMTPHGIPVLVVNVDTPRKAVVGAIAIHDLKEGDRCTLLWVDHYGNEGNPMHGDRFAVRTKAAK